MLRFFIPLLALLPLLGNSQINSVAPGKAVSRPEQGFSIVGEINGLTKGATVKLVNANTGMELASGIVQEKISTAKKNGKTVSTARTFFSLKGTMPEPDLCQLSIGELSPYNIYVENARISITGAAAAANKWVVKGSASHRDFQHFETVFTPLAMQLNSTAASINNMAAGGNRDSLMKIYTSTQKTIQDQIDKFITGKSSSYVSPFVLLVMKGFNEDPLLLENRFNKLAPAIKNSYLGKAVSADIAKARIGAIGTPALEFVQPDTSGNPISLSSFRGKYVLVDFWASWCGPCRHENPTVVYNFQKFSNKNFTVLGVSLDRPGQKDKWLQAIKEDNLTWTQVSDLKFWENEAARLYQVTGIPQNFLVDPNGIIIAKNLRGPALEAKLCEVFGCN